MPRSARRYYSLTVVSQTLSVHPQAVRYYEREGLISSVVSGGERYYAPAEVERLRVIIQLRQELGVNLAGIEVILGMREKIQHLRRQMAELHERAGAPAPARREEGAAPVTIQVREEP